MNQQRKDEENSIDILNSYLTNVEIKNNMDLMKVVQLSTKTNEAYINDLLKINELLENIKLKVDMLINDGPTICKGDPKMGISNIRELIIQEISKVQEFVTTNCEKINDLKDKIDKFVFKLVPIVLGLCMSLVTALIILLRL